MMTDYKKLCRACLTSLNSSNNAFNENVSPEDYLFCTSVEILKNDELPKIICDVCYDLMTNFIEFKKACIHSNNILLACTTIKVENEFCDKNKGVNNSDVGTGGCLEDEPMKDVFTDECNLNNAVIIKQEESTKHIDNGSDDSMIFADLAPTIPVKKDEEGHKSKEKPARRRNRRVLKSRPYKNYSEEMLLLAIENVKEKRMSSRSAEKTFGIPRRTILNKIKEHHSKNVGSPIRLSFEEEKSIVKVLIAAGEYGSPLTKLDLRLTVFEYLKKNQREDVFHGKPPGKDWVQSFLERHADELSVRSTQNIKTARAQKTRLKLQKRKQKLRN